LKQALIKRDQQYLERDTKHAMA